MQDLKQKVLESLKTKGYHEYQLKELNPIIQATVEATRQALSLGAVSNRTFEYRVVDHDMFEEHEIRTMNSMSSKGWEIIRILEPMKWLNSDGMFVRIYYKREKQS